MKIKNEQNYIVLCCLQSILWNHYLKVFFSTQVLCNWCRKFIWTFDHTFISIKIRFTTFYRNVLHFHTFFLPSTTFPLRRGTYEAGCLAASSPCFSFRIRFPQGAECCLVSKYLLSLFLFERPVLLGLNHWWIGNLSSLAMVNNHQVLPSPARVWAH